MTKSTITRERLQEIADDGFLKHGESKVLARMALAAMNSEPEYLPLDYLQGHRDGLEWSARLAESNHPQTGDWLYDDPIELAKAIRKGPDMPPAQPVAGSEPDRNPVLAYADSYRDMAKQGIESVPIWSVITDLERNIAPLYRHAQPAPAVPNGLRLALSNAGIAAPESDEMLAATCEKHIQALVTWVKDRKPFQSAPVVPSFEEWLSAANRKPLGWVKDAMREAYDTFRAAMLQAGNSPVIPDGYVMVPVPDEFLSAEQNASGMFELSEDCMCRLAVALSQQSKGLVTPPGYVMVPKEPTDEMISSGIAAHYNRSQIQIHDRPAPGPMECAYVAMLAAADCSIPMISDRWISVSERMPEDRTQVILWDAEIGEVTSGHYSHKTQTFYHYGDAIENEITHWMPPPCAPQEVNRE
ncbi:DUF551 domain-containing protein [Klebsiella grimontii]|uniref:DUF551 domain-containing protein n=1 Tax=Klebsiella grimontii TaxID=2058152 RepID=UPI0012B7C463